MEEQYNNDDNDKQKLIEGIKNKMNVTRFESWDETCRHGGNQTRFSESFVDIVVGYTMW